MTRPPAPPLTPDEAATVARFDAAEPAPESWEATVERVTRAMCGPDGDGPGLGCGYDDLSRGVQAGYRRLAVAAIDAMKDGDR